LNILAAPISNKLQNSKATFTQTFNDVTVLFLDIVGFSKLANEIGTERIVLLLNDFFTQMDDLLDNYKIEKIKTIGDAYMTAAGIPEQYETNCEETIRFALASLDLLEQFNKENNTAIQVRIGINSGPVVAGIIGKKKFIYDLWGINVNLASRMESYGTPGRIHVSKGTYEKLKNTYSFEKQLPINIKGFGLLETYLLAQ
jgi:class 3 adenylate cyclase